MSEWFPPRCRAGAAGELGCRLEWAGGRVEQHFSRDEEPDDRDPRVLAYAWAARATTVSLEMVVPGFIGYFIDVWLGTRGWFTVLGFAIGLAGGMWHLVRMTSGK